LRGEICIIPSWYHLAGRKILPPSRKDRKGRAKKKISLGRKKGFAWVYGWSGLDKKKTQRGNSGFLRVQEKGGFCASQEKEGNSGPLRALFYEIVPAFPPANILPAFPIHFSSLCSSLAFFAP
jgi:hypothetical protein